MRRLRAEKRQTLADLEKKLLELGETNFRFLIVGDGDEREYLEKTMSNADFTGFISGEELAQAYANMDIFVFPSETETFGNVVQEAISSGVPAIVSNSGGPKFVINEGKSGFVAAGFEDFVRYTVELMSNSEKLLKLKETARQSVLSNSWDSVFEGVYENYNKTLEIASKDRAKQDVINGKFSQSAGQ